MSLLDRIYYEASSEDGILSLEESLRGLYEQIPEIKEHYVHMWKVLDEIPMTEEQKEKILNEWELSRNDEERQGFRNGVRFGFLLSRELMESAER